MTEHEYEPVAGLPERLPAGEAMLWQGAPRWQSMARHAMHARKVALYFLALLLLHLVWELTGGEPLPSALAGALRLAVPAALAVGLLAFLAWTMSRATLYTITSRRVVLRFGVAVPITINLPFSQIANAALREHGDGTGDIPLALSGRVRTSYWILWPHARPWHFSPPQPMLRAIPEASKVARILAAALQSASSGSAPAGGAGGSPDPAGTVRSVSAGSRDQQPAARAPLDAPARAALR